MKYYYGAVSRTRDDIPSAGTWINCLLSQYVKLWIEGACQL